jgi:hypothetical protein
MRTPMKRPSSELRAAPFFLDACFLAFAIGIA